MNTNRNVTVWILAASLLLCSFLLVSCGGGTETGDESASQANVGEIVTPEATASDTDETQGVTEAVSDPAETAAEEAESATEPETSGSTDDPSVQGGGAAVKEPLPGSVEALNWTVTDVLSATYLGEWKGETQAAYRFTVEKQYRGLTLSGDIWIEMYPTGDTSHVAEDKDCPFRTGETYLFLIRRRADVYSEHGFVFFTDFEDLQIRASDVQGATLWGKALQNSLSCFEITEQTTMDDLGQYFAGLFAEQPDYIGRDFIRSDDVGEIVRGADLVAVVHVDKINARLAHGVMNCQCSVVTLLKGSCKEGTTFMAQLKASDVSEGDTVLVTLLDSDALPGLYLYAAPAAVFSAERSAEFAAQLGNG